MNKHLSSVIPACFAAAWLAGCSSMEAPQTARPALSCAAAGTASVSVGQLQVDPSDPTKATVDVTPGALPIGTGNVSIVWTYTGTGYVFLQSPPNSAIGFGGYTNPAVAGPMNQGSGGSPTTYVLCFGPIPASPPLAWQYSLLLQGTSAAAKVWKCDPTIINSNSLLSPALASVPVPCTTPP